MRTSTRSNPDPATRSRQKSPEVVTPTPGQRGGDSREDQQSGSQRKRRANGEQGKTGDLQTNGGAPRAKRVRLGSLTVNSSDQAATSLVNGQSVTGRLATSSQRPSSVSSMVAQHELVRSGSPRQDAVDVEEIEVAPAPRLPSAATTPQYFNTDSFADVHLRFTTGSVTEIAKCHSSILESKSQLFGQWIAVARSARERDIVAIDVDGGGIDVDIDDFRAMVTYIYTSLYKKPTDGTWVAHWNRREYARYCGMFDMAEDALNALKQWAEEQTKINSVLSFLKEFQSLDFEGELDSIAEGLENKHLPNRVSGHCCKRCEKGDAIVRVDRG